MKRMLRAFFLLPIALAAVFFTSCGSSSDVKAEIREANRMEVLLSSCDAVSAVCTVRAGDEKTESLSCCTKEGYYRAADTESGTASVFFSGDLFSAAEDKIYPAFSTDFLPDAFDLFSLTFSTMPDLPVTSDATEGDVRTVTLSDGQTTYICRVGKSQLRLLSETYEKNGEILLETVFAYDEIPAKARDAFAACRAERERIASLPEGELHFARIRMDGLTYVLSAEKGSPFSLTSPNRSFYIDEACENLLYDASQIGLSDDLDIWVGELAPTFEEILSANSIGTLSQKYAYVSYSGDFSGLSVCLGFSRPVYCEGYIYETGPFAMVLSDRMIVAVTDGAAKQYFLPMSEEEYDSHFDSFFFGSSDLLSVTRCVFDEEVVEATVGNDLTGSVRVKLDRNDLRILEVVLPADVTGVGDIPLTFSYGTEDSALPEEIVLALAYIDETKTLLPEDCRKLTFHCGEGDVILTVRKGEGFLCDAYYTLFADEACTKEAVDNLYDDAEFWVAVAIEIEGVSFDGTSG